MSYIKLAIVDDNLDPLGIGRVRYKVMGESSSARERGVKYEPWDSNDPFLAKPFLPTNINYIPEVGQTIKIVTYDPNNDLVNREYIAGPFTTIHDFNSQVNSQQLGGTSYGGVVKKTKDLINSVTGTYKNKKSEGSLAKFSDYAIYGPYGSDVLFTENGISLRGGKYLSKDSPKAAKEDIQSLPIRTDKTAIFSLKKFSSKQENKLIKVSEFVIPKGKLNYVVEYNVDSLTNPTTISWYVYEVKDVYGDTFNTSVFNANTAQDLISYSNSVKLINLDNTTVTPTFIQSVTSYQLAYVTIRRTIDLLNTKGLREFDKRLPNVFLHPFYFRPVKTLTDIDFLKNVKPTTNIESINGSGLYYSMTENSPRGKEVVTEENRLSTVSKNIEQTFGSLTSDKIYFISTDTNKSGNLSIPFDKLNKYEYTQEELLTLIEPNTYATVRGENLIKALILLYKVIKSHTHNPGKLIPLETPHLFELEKVFETLENDILNKSIRIN